MHKTVIEEKCKKKSLKKQEQRIKHNSSFTGSTGTSEYMSPSTVNGQPTGIECDLWALGVVFFQCITGTYCTCSRESRWEGKGRE